MMGAIAGADFELLTSAEAGPRFVGVTELFADAVEAIDAAREAHRRLRHLHVADRPANQ
jgi:hypothetical protein